MPETLELTFCPQCDMPAEIEDRSVLQSTDGPIALVRIRCLNGHWSNMPESELPHGMV
jgi:hypothetical protein